MKTITVILLVILAQVSFSQNSDWIFRNPNPQNDFYGIKFFDLNTGYVVGSNGIILKNTTGSSNWINIPSGTTNNLYGLCFFDVNHGYVIGQGELAMYTSNGGNSWISYSIPNGLSFRSVSFINQSTGFIAGDNGSLYKTTTGIAGFTPINVTTTNLHSVFMVDSLKIFACGDSGKFLKTTDGGNNWTVQTISANNLLSLSFTNALTGYVSANISPLLKTTDAGNSWVNTNFNYSNSVYSVKFINPNTGFAVGTNSPLMKTTNGGVAWSVWCSNQLFWGNTYTDICPLDSGHAYTCGLHGITLKSIDTGAAYYNQWSIALGGCRSSLTYLSFVNENTGIVVGDNVFLNTTNGGTKWNVSLVGNNSWFESEGYITSAFLFPSGSMYRVYYSPGHASPPSYSIDNSTDGGVTWNGNRSFGQTNAYFSGLCEIEGVTYVSYTSLFVGIGISKNSGSGWSSVYSSSNGLGGISFANQNTGMVIGGGATKGSVRTTNGGANWTFIPTGNARSLTGIQLLSTGAGYLTGDSSNFMKTTDFGATWSQVTSNIIIRYPNTQFVNDNTGWVLGNNISSGASELYYTTSGCQNFVELQSLGAFQPKSFSFINALTGYVSGDSGVVLKTTNGGLTFINSTSSNIPDKFSLSQNYPNPFNPSTVIRFQVPVVGNGRDRSVKMIIYDVLGREITTLVDQQMQPGSYSVEWDALSYPSGVYFYKLSINNEQLAVRKMVLIK